MLFSLYSGLSCLYITSFMYLTRNHILPDSTYLYILHNASLLTCSISYLLFLLRICGTLNKITITITVTSIWCQIAGWDICVLFTKQEWGEAIVRRLQIVVSDWLINWKPILQYQWWKKLPWTWKVVKQQRYSSVQEYQVVGCGAGFCTVTDWLLFRLGFLKLREEWMMFL
jgi:hypothetical protein